MPGRLGKAWDCRQAEALRRGDDGSERGEMGLEHHGGRILEAIVTHELHVTSGTPHRVG